MIPPVFRRMPLPLAFTLLVLVAIAIEGCTHRSVDAAVRSAEAARAAESYQRALAACRTENATCLGYVACRKRVALEHGSTYEGRCEP